MIKKILIKLFTPTNYYKKLEKRIEALESICGSNESQRKLIKEAREWKNYQKNNWCKYMTSVKI